MARDNEGNSNAARIAMIAITTNNSINVNAPGTPSVRSQRFVRVFKVGVSTFPADLYYFNVGLNRILTTKESVFQREIQ